MKHLNQWIGRTGCAVVVSGLMFASESGAGLFFWDNDTGSGIFSAPGNWNPEGTPGAADLAVHNDPAKAAITINGDWSVDSLRLSDGAGVTHESGTLRIADNVGPDDGLWVGEFGNNIVTYNFKPPQQNLWVCSGSGSRPNV